MFKYCDRLMDSAVRAAAPPHTVLTRLLPRHQLLTAAVAAAVFSLSTRHDFALWCCSQSRDHALPPTTPLRHGPKVRDITVIIPPGPVMDGFLEAFVTVFGQLHN